MIVKPKETTPVTALEIKEDGENKEFEDIKPVDVTPVHQAETEPAFELTSEERRIVENMVMGESGGESYEGQVLVAQCILNACLKDDLQPSEVRVEYQYAGWNDNPSDSVKNAVQEVFDEGFKVTEEPILYFYAPKYCEGAWHETQVYVLALDGHKFFKEKTIGDE